MFKYLPRSRKTRVKIVSLTAPSTSSHSPYYGNYASKVRNKFNSSIRDIWRSWTINGKRQFTGRNKKYIRNTKKI